MRITIETHDATPSDDAERRERATELDASISSGDTVDTAAIDAGGPAADLAAEVAEENDLEMGAPPAWLTESEGGQDRNGSDGDGHVSDAHLAGGHLIGDAGGAPEF